MVGRRAMSSFVKNPLASDDLLARARLTRDEHRHLGGRDLLDEREDVLKRGAATGTRTSALAIVSCVSTASTSTGLFSSFAL
jgi:hypothetical protein